MISTSHIKHKRQLTKENLTLIFQVYYRDKNVEIEQVSGDSQEVGAHYQSDISRLKIKFAGTGKEIKIIVKEPLQTFLVKWFTKFTKPFMRETFWYVEALPTLKEKYPEIENISAKTYHSTTAYLNNYE